MVYRVLLALVLACCCSWPLPCSGQMPECDLNVPEDYAKLEPPVIRLSSGKQPVLVTLNITLMGLIEADDHHQTVDVVYGVLAQWRDPRLAFAGKGGCLGGVVDALNFRKNFWNPSMFFHNVKKLSNVGNFDDPFTVVFAMGVIITGRTVHSNMICKYDFTRYPFDIHECDLQIGSIRAEFEDVRFKANFEYDSRIQNVLQYELSFDLLPDDSSIKMAGFNLSVAGVKIKMARRYSHYIYNLYVPTLVLTLASYISFFIPHDIIAGRMGMLVTLFLMLINTSNSVRAVMPRASGVTAAEVWLSCCTGAISFVLLQYAFLLRRRLKLKRRIHRSRDAALEKAKLAEFNNWAEDFDFKCFIFGVTVTILFAIAYSTVYVTMYEGHTTTANEENFDELGSRVTLNKTKIKQEEDPEPTKEEAQQPTEKAAPEDAEPVDGNNNTVQAEEDSDNTEKSNNITTDTQA